ncbi:hypothetical protein SNEBB_006422 [Seison nebaliae]|nr:hypothetical protein SNEBB_006422 [Seison nebaliae]
MEKNKECVFQQEIIIKYVPSISSSEELRRKIIVSVFIVTHANRKELFIRLTDDIDPFFLYTLTLDENDFQQIKSNQGLLVDFLSFPQKFIELLNLCIENQNINPPKFQLQLLVNENGSLNVVEINPFKHLTHLSLLLLNGNDTEVKIYLAECLTKLKEENRLQRKEKNELHEKMMGEYEMLNEKLKTIQKERDSFEKEYLLSKDAFEMKLEKHQNEDRNTIFELRNELTKRLQEQKETIENEQKNRMTSLEKEKKYFEEKCEKCIKRSNLMEDELNGLKSKEKSLMSENDRINLELSQMKNEKKCINNEQQTKDKAMNHIRTRVAVLEEETKHKDMLIERLNEQLEAEKMNIKKSEEAIERYVEDIHRSKKNIKELSYQLLEVNERLKNQEYCATTRKSKMKLKNELIKEMEKVIEDNRTSINHLKIKENELNHEKDDLTIKLNQLQIEVESKESKLNEALKTIESNEKMLLFLNKSVNELQLNQNKHSTPTTLSSKSNKKLTNTTENSQFSNRMNNHRNRTPNSQPISSSSNCRTNNSSKFRPMNSTTNHHPLTSTISSNLRFPMQKSNTLNNLKNDGIDIAHSKDSIDPQYFQPAKDQQQSTKEPFDAVLARLDLNSTNINNSNVLPNTSATPTNVRLLAKESIFFN